MILEIVNFNCLFQILFRSVLNVHSNQTLNIHQFGVGSNHPIKLLNHVDYFKRLMLIVYLTIDSKMLGGKQVSFQCDHIWPFNSSESTDSGCLGLAHVCIFVRDIRRVILTEVLFKNLVKALSILHQRFQFRSMGFARHIIKVWFLGYSAWALTWNKSINVRWSLLKYYFCILRFRTYQRINSLLSSLGIFFWRNVW